MVSVDPYLLGFVVLTLAALVIGIILGLLRQPSVIAYILTGAIVGPFGLKLITDGSLISSFGELGVILLLFFVGTSISLAQIARRWKIAVLGTILQIVLSVSVVFVLGQILGWSLGMIVLLGFVISLSSTAVIIKILESRKEMDTKLGQDVIGILIMQDLAVIPMMIVLSAISGESTSLLKIGLNFMGGLLAIALVLGIIKRGFINLPFGKRIESDPELQVLAALVMCFGIALLSESFELSAAFGAFIAGMSLSSIKEMQWIKGNLQPFKVLFIAFFFISIGMMIDLAFLGAHLFELSMLLVVVLFVNTLLNAFIFRWNGESWRNSLYGGSLLAQIGEFSFVLVAIGLQSGIIVSSTYQLTLQLIALSLVISPFWISFFRSFVDKSTLIKETFISGDHEGRIKMIKNLIDPNNLPVIVDEHRIERRMRRLQSWIDKMTFSRIFFLWFFVIFSFGLGYFYLPSSENYLMYASTNLPIESLGDAIYFSFIYATTTGYGGIIPVGLFKILAVFEVVCGWLLLAAVTTRLISVKQDIIIGELYKASLRSEIAGLRTSLRLFRQNIDDFMTHLEEGTLRKRAVNDLHRYLASFEENLIRVKAIIPEDGDNDFKKNPEEEDLEILLNAVLTSLEKVDELMKTKAQGEIAWRTETAFDYIKSSMNVCEIIFIQANNSNLFKPEALKRFNSRKDAVFSSLTDEIKKSGSKDAPKQPGNK